MIFTAFYLFLGIFSNWFRFSLITAKLVRVKNVIRRNSFYTSANNSDNEEEDISSLDIEIDEGELVKERSILGEAAEASSGDLDVTPNSAQEKVMSFDVAREVDENGQLVISNTPELTQEADRISNSESSGEVIRGNPHEHPALPGWLFGHQIFIVRFGCMTVSWPESVEYFSRKALN